jgi:hypothetical protein
MEMGTKNERRKELGRTRKVKQNRRKDEEMVKRERKRRKERRERINGKG